MNRREFLTSILKLSALSAIPFPLLGDPATKQQTGQQNFHGTQLPVLGLGTMRLPLFPGTKRINTEEAKRMIDFALAHGINYFDTAPNYRHGESESFLGTALSSRRDSCLLASKLPLAGIGSPGDARNIVESQLRRCRTGCFDFYMLQMPNSANFDRILKLKLPELLQDLKRKGMIRFAGFSFFDSPQTLERLIPLAPWDFVQLDINYIDWELCQTNAVCALLKRHGISVFAVDPLRGGDLNRLSPGSGASPAEWAFRFAASVPGVAMTLCNAASQRELETAFHALRKPPFSAAERNTLVQAAARYRENGTVSPCGNCCCSDADPALDTRCTVFCPLSIHPKRRELL